MTFAGIPPTTTLSGTSSDTTAPAATTEFSPMVTPERIVALAPIQAPFFFSICPVTTVFRSAGDRGWPSDSRLSLGAINTLSLIVIPPKSKKIQSKLMNTFFPIRVFFPVVDIQGGEDDDGLVNFGAGDFMEVFSDFSRIGGIIHPYQEFFCSKGSIEHLPCLRIFRVDGFTGSQPIKYIILHSLYYS